MTKIENIKNTEQQPAPKPEKKSWFKRFVIWFFVFILALIVGLFITINLPVTKKFLANKAIELLNNDFKAGIKFEDIEVNFFGDVKIKQLTAKDHRQFEFIKIKELQAESDWFSLIFDTNNIQFQKIILLEPDVKVFTYKGEDQDNFSRYIANFDSEDEKKSDKVFQLGASVSVIDGKVSIINQNSEGDQGVWLDARNVNLSANNLKIVGPDISAQINRFTFITKRWGKEHFVETFSANFAITDQYLSFKDLTLNTDHSLLQGDVKFNLDKKTGWQDFSDKVTWDMHLKKGSQISGYDVSYFVTNWDNYVPINLSGNLNGALNKLTLKDFNLKSNNVNIYTSEIKAANLLKGNFDIKTNQLSAVFTYKSLKAILPSFISKKMGGFADDFGTLKYNGKASVSPNSVYAKGNLISGIGQANLDFTLSNFSRKTPKYKGTLVVNNLNVAALTKTKQIGLVSGRVIVEGEGFDLNTLRLKTQTNLQSIHLLGKPLNNIIIDGILAHKQFNGIININDNQAKGRINGKIDFSSPRISADVLADIGYLNLNYFGAKGENLTFRGMLRGKASLTNINDLTLDAEINNVLFTTGNQKINIAEGNLLTYFENKNRIMDIQIPNTIQGKISGNYQLDELPNMLIEGASNIIAGNIPTKFYKGRNLDFNFSIGQNLVDFLDPNLKLKEELHLEGSYSGDNNYLVLNANLAGLDYFLPKKENAAQINDLMNSIPNLNLPTVEEKDNITADNISININTFNTNEQLVAKIGRLKISNNVFQDIALVGNKTDQNIAHISTKFNLGSLEDEKNNALKSHEINLSQSLDGNGDYVIKFDPTAIKLNDMVWMVDTSAELDHSITFRKKTGDFLVKNLRFYSDDDELFINGSFKDAKNFNTEVKVNNLEVEKLLALANIHNVDIKGVANGSLNLVVDQANLKPIIDLTIEDLTINNELLGDLVVLADNSEIKNIYDIKAKLVTEKLLGKNTLDLHGTVDNNTPSPTLDIKANLKDFDMSFIESFAENVFSNMRGKATGLVTIDGTLEDFNYNGDLALKGFGLELNFSGVDYSFEDTTVSLINGNLLLDQVKVSDGRKNSNGSISGLVMLGNFNSIAVNLIVRSENLMLLDTTQNDFDTFWGKIYAKSEGIFVSFDNNNLKIDTKAEVLSNSIFTLNSNTTSSVDEFKVLRFLKRDETGLISVDEKKKVGVDMAINLELDVNKDSQINVLVGDEIGDISARGTAKGLKFSMNKGNMSMEGSYIVDSGSYISKAILEKTFQISKGSKIEWMDNVMDPSLDIVANYSRVVNNVGEYLNMGKLPPVKINLEAIITRNLKNPQIDFDIKSPEVSSQVKETLVQKISDPDQKIIQFGAILLLNSFIISDGDHSGVNVSNSLSSSGVNMVVKQLGSVFNSISQVFKIDLNYIAANSQNNTGDRATTNFDIALSPRFTITTGLGIPISKTDNSQTNYFTGEGSIEYDWSRNNDGSRLLRAYSKPSNIGLMSGSNAGSNQNYGAGVVYSKNFNTIFKKKKEKKPTKRNIKRDSIIKSYNSRENVKVQ